MDTKLNIDAISSVVKSITWSELKDLRDDSELTPGLKYRITDYTCTTTQENTQSAGHQFDIIVTALSEDTLSEEASAVLHDGDAYFANSNLSAWKLWYCLDNDTDRFAWADSTNGKGVICRMIDEWNNDCPYDFKNIQFKRKLTDGQYDPENGTDTWVYTFNLYETPDDIFDVSVAQFMFHNDEGGYTHTYENIIKPYGEGEDGDGGYSYGRPYRLNDNVFLNVLDGNAYFGCYSNTFGDNCYNNTFGNDCYNNTFGVRCCSNTFGNYCYNNTFGNDCSGIIFGDGCTSNTFGSSCYHITFDDSAAVAHVNVFSGTSGDAIPVGTNGSYCQFVGVNSSGVLKVWVPADSAS